MVLLGQLVLLEAGGGEYGTGTAALNEKGRGGGQGRCAGLHCGDGGGGGGGGGGGAEGGLVAGLGGQWDPLALGAHVGGALLSPPAALGGLGP